MCRILLKVFVVNTRKQKKTLRNILLKQNNEFKKIENNPFYYTTSNIVMQTMQEFFLTKHGDEHFFGNVITPS